MSIKRGNKVKLLNDIELEKSFSKGQEGVVTKAKSGFIFVTDEGEELNSIQVEFENGTLQLSKNDIERVNKFEVGDKAFFRYATGESVVQVWGVVYSEREKNYLYAVKGEKGEFLVVEFLLSPLKKRDRLKEGDKFKTETGITYKVLFRKYDEYREETVYIAKDLEGELKGRVSVAPAKFIDKIIYGDDN